MFIYNVTVTIADTEHGRWLRWMQEKHIPDVMATGCFMNARMSKLMFLENEGTSYSIQYAFRDMKEIERYQSQHAPALQAEHKDEFGESYAAFRTVMEVVYENSGK